jgi:hypothetical protein
LPNKHAHFRARHLCENGGTLVRVEVLIHFQQEDMLPL